MSARVVSEDEFRSFVRVVQLLGRRVRLFGCESVERPAGWRRYGDQEGDVLGVCCPLSVWVRMADGEVVSVPEDACEAVGFLGVK